MPIQFVTGGYALAFIFGVNWPVQSIKRNDRFHGIHALTPPWLHACYYIAQTSNIIPYCTRISHKFMQSLMLPCCQKKKEKTYILWKVFAPLGWNSVYEKFQLSLINSFVWNKLIVIHGVKLIRLAKVISYRGDQDWTNIEVVSNRPLFFM